MQKLRIVTLVLVLTLAVAGAGASVLVIDRVTDPQAGEGFEFPQDADLLELWFPPVYEADCTILVRNGRGMMIDCGTSEDYEWIAETMRVAGIGAVSDLLITHPHHDHAGSVSRLVANGKVLRLLACHDEKENSRASIMLSTARSASLPILMLQNTHRFSYSGVKVETWILPRPRARLNHRSALIRISYGDFVYVSFSDVEDYGMQEIMKEEKFVNDPGWFDCDVFRYPHHGAEPLPEGMAELLSPSAAIITGAHNIDRPGKRYAATIADSVLYTDQKIIRLRTDGQTVVIDYAR